MCDRVAALTHRVAERTVTDVGVTVSVTDVGVTVSVTVRLRVGMAPLSVLGWVWHHCPSSGGMLLSVLGWVWPISPSSGGYGPSVRPRVLLSVLGCYCPSSGIKRCYS